MLGTILRNAGTTATQSSAIWGRPRQSMEVIMSWIILFFAGLFEVGWAVGLKYTDGFSRRSPPH
jgi:hypothetical protein